MDFSLFYFAEDSAPAAGGGRYELLIEGARFADRNGFRAVWTPERHFHAFGGLYPNPAVLGAAVATVTEHVSIRAGSVVSPLHHPVRIAEEWAVVDNLSGGRAGVSFASGWHPVDFALSSTSFADRKAVMWESVEQVRTLWRGGCQQVKDGNGREAAVRVFPPPVQRELPVWITSGGEPETFRTAARVRAGVLTHLLHQDIPELAEKIAEYRRLAREAHEGWTGHVVLMLHTCLGADRREVRERVRAPMHTYLRSSIGLIARSFATTDPDFRLESLDDEDIDFIVARSFDTYFDERGLFGTVEEAARTVARLRAIGVDEIACLIDFGVATQTVLSRLPYINELREACARNREVDQA